MGWRCLLCAFFLLTIHSNMANSSTAAARCHLTDSAALFEFLNSLEIKQPSGGVQKGKLCTDTQTWNQSVDCCSWTGIACDYVTGHVVTVDLLNFCFKGTLSSNSTIFKLKSLQKLQLSRSSLEGSALPKEIGRLANLTILEMSGTNLTGSIPTSICNLNKLQRLDLSANQLTGKLPICIFDFVDLDTVNLIGNRLKGSLPPTISGGSKLVFLLLASNLLDGTVPSWLFTIPSLELLDLGDNHLTGPIESFPRPAVTLLHSISLHNNNIRGSFPLSVLQLVNLTAIHLYDNQLSGILKWSMFKEMVELSVLWLQRNRGLSFENDENSPTVLQKLSSMDVSYCNLKEFPLVGIQSLFYLNISHTGLTGQILTAPYLTSGWGNLETLDASHNLITGFDKYPTNITTFDLSFNHLQGTLTQPPDKIWFLSFGHNNLTGKIPSDFCRLDQLYSLDLSFNHLTGNVPFCLVNMSKSEPYFQLNLEGNHFNISSAL